jgi:hypothetical protein
MQATARPARGKTAAAKVAFRYDVAISATSFDACTALQLAQRLRVRFPTSVFNVSEHRDAAADALTDGFVASALSMDARLVVVLHQRLWGTAGATATEATLLEHRAREKGASFLRMIALEPAPHASWMPAKDRWLALTPAGIEPLVDTIVADVIRLGGEPRDESPVEVEERAQRAVASDRERETFLRSAKGVTGAKREFEALVDDICRQVSTVATDTPELHRTPDRCIVQAGRAGLSLSWIRARSSAVADSRLVIIEWDGTITPPGAARRDGVVATPVREQELQLDATSPTSWRWRTPAQDGVSYTSSGLAAQCVELLRHRSTMATT